MQFGVSGGPPGISPASHVVFSRDPATRPYLAAGASTAFPQGIPSLEVRQVAAKALTSLTRPEGMVYSRDGSAVSAGKAVLGAGGGVGGVLNAVAAGLGHTAAPIEHSSTSTNAAPVARPRIDRSQVRVQGSGPGVS